MFYDPYVKVDRNRGGHVRFSSVVYTMANNPVLRIGRDENGVISRHTIWGAELDSPYDEEVNEEDF